MLSINPVLSGYLGSGEVVSAEVLREKQAFAQMEQIFLHTLLKEMRKTIPEGGLFEKSNGAKIFEDMLDEVLSLKMAESGQLGVAEAMEAQYRLREAAGRRNGLHFQGFK